MRSDKINIVGQNGTERRRVPVASGFAVGPRGKTLAKRVRPHRKSTNCGGGVGDERRNRGRAASCRVGAASTEKIVEGGAHHRDVGHKVGHQAHPPGHQRAELPPPPPARSDDPPGAAPSNIGRSVSA